MFAQLIVRAVVSDDQDREPFDTWYAQDHMAVVIATFRPRRCWRSWSILDPAVHYACYEFETIARLRAMMETAEFAELVADFTKTWSGRVTREREVLAASQLYEADSIARAAGS